MEFCGNVLYHHLGGSYTSVDTSENGLSHTLQSCAHYVPHLCMFYTLIFLELEFLDQRGSLPLCLQAISTPVPQSPLQTKSVLKITRALTSKERGLWNPGMKRWMFVRMNRSGQARGRDTRSNHWMTNPGMETGVEALAT